MEQEIKITDEVRKILRCRYIKYLGGQRKDFDEVIMKDAEFLILSIHDNGVRVSIITSFAGASKLVFISYKDLIKYWVFENGDKIEVINNNHHKDNKM